MPVAIFTILAYNALAVLLLATVGKSALYILRIKILLPFKRTFFEFLSGMLVLVFCTALYHTTGKTVMLFLLLPIGAMWYHYKEANKAQKLKIDSFSSQIKPYSIVFLVSIIWAYITFFLLHTGNGNINTPHDDYVFNAKNAVYLATFGIENTTLEQYYNQNIGIVPYHYFELWLNVFFFQIFQIPSLLSLIFIVFPIGITCIMMGFCALAEHFKLLNSKIIFFSFLFLFFTGVYLPFYNNIFLLNTSNVFVRNSINYPKLFSIYLFLQAFALLFFAKRYYIAYNLLLIIPVLFISTVIGVLVGMCSYFILYFILDKKNKAIYMHSFILYVIFAFFVFVFYFIFRDKTNIALSKASELPTINIAYFRTVFNVFVGVSIQYFVLYFPVLFLFLWATVGKRDVFWKSNFKSVLLKYRYIIIFLLIYFSTLASWALLHSVPDSVQLFSNITIPLISISVFLFVLHCVAHRVINQVGLFSVLGVILCFNIYTTQKEVLYNYPIYSTKYEQAIQDNIANKQPLGAFLLDKKEYNSVFAFNTDFRVLGQYLSILGSQYHIISLSVFEMPDLPIAEAYKQKSTFYKFVESQKKANNFVSIPQSQIDFVKKYKIDYLIISPKVTLAEHWKPLIDKEIIDQKSGEHFIFLKR
ncbi:MAG: hypothetical protein EAZ95_04345 [Bacteroidetes bacterium]|nr:MAG: hypothetical protein EAZ95_04345 [Bacteroidota bacterium]